MLYLIRSYGIGGKSILKVGYTKDLDGRFNDYFTANPYYEKISTREGDKKLEDLIHFCLIGLGLQTKVNNRLKEWFQDDPRVRDIFHYPRKKIENLIWENRNKAFNPLKIRFRDTLDFELYDYLYKTHRRTFRGDRFKAIGGKIIDSHAFEVDVVYKECYLSQELRLNPLPRVFSEELVKLVDDFLVGEFYSTRHFNLRLEAYCNFMDKYKPLYGQDVVELVYHRTLDDTFRSYYDYFGTSGCKAKEYRKGELEKGIKDTLNLSYDLIYETFEVGKRYTLKEIKQTLADIYGKMKLNRSPKASDLQEFFEVSDIKVYDSQTKKQSKGYLIKNIKNSSPEP